MLGWIPTAYILSAAVFLVPFGRLADIVGRKRIFSYGVIIYTLSCLISVVSNSAAMLLISRLFQGIGASMFFGTSTAILTSVFPPGERGKVLGINVATVYTGLSAGPLLGGFLTQHFGWRSIFLFTVPFGVLIIVFIIWKFKSEWAEAKGEKFDFIGSIIYVLSIIAIIYGMSLLPDLAASWIILFGIIGVLAFIRWEANFRSPVLDIKLFSNATFAFSNLATLINYSATYAISFLISLYLQYIKGLDPQNAGLVLVAMPAVQAFFSIFAGRLSDRLEPRILASAGMALTAIGLLFFVFLSYQTTLVFVIACLMLLGFGFALFSSPNVNSIMSSVDKRFYGVASGIMSTMRSTGQMFSMAIAMLIFAIFIGRVQIVPEYYPAFLTSVKVAFMIFAVLCLGGIFASMARGKAKH